MLAQPQLPFAVHAVVCALQHWQPTPVAAAELRCQSRSLAGLLLSHAHTGSGQPASSSRTARQDTLLACRFATNFSDDYELGECIGKGTLRSHTRGLDMQCSSHCVLASHAGGVMSHEKRMVWRCA